MVEGRGERDTDGEGVTGRVCAPDRVMEGKWGVGVGEPCCTHPLLCVAALEATGEGEIRGDTVSVAVPDWEAVEVAVVQKVGREELVGKGEEEWEEEGEEEEVRKGELLGQVEAEGASEGDTVPPWSISPPLTPPLTPP